MENDERVLEISLYDGEFVGDVTSLTPICVLEGSVTPYDREPFSPLEEAWRLLEMCSEKYAIPPSQGDCFTAFIGRKNRGNVEVESLIRLDVHAHNGEATACVMSQLPAWETERVRYHPDDSAVTIVLRILKSNVGDVRR